jgi:hypothetical protein
MEISVNHTSAMKVLRDSLGRAKSGSISGCQIAPATDFILTGKNCLTYRYILLTALTAKATNEKVDILSLQAGDESAGAYDARSLASRVIYPFQRDFLDDYLDGSNEDPLVNNPGRNARIQKSNKAASGDPRSALDLLCRYLPLINNSEDAQRSLDYFLAQCVKLKKRRQEQALSFADTISNVDQQGIRIFMGDLLDKGFGGAALSLVVASIFELLLPDCRVMPHPVNQSGASGKQMGDIDIFKADGSPYLALELKDKPFTESELAKAARTAFKSNAPAMLFVAGRASTLSEETNRYFDETKIEYGKKGMVIGVIPIDALLDFFFTTRQDADAATIVAALENAMDRIRCSPEVQGWVYRKSDEL